MARRNGRAVETVGEGHTTWRGRARGFRMALLLCARTESKSFAAVLQSCARGRRVESCGNAVRRKWRHGVFDGERVASWTHMEMDSLHLRPDELRLDRSGVCIGDRELGPGWTRLHAQLCDAYDATRRASRKRVRQSYTKHFPHHLPLCAPRHSDPTQTHGLKMGLRSNSISRAILRAIFNEGRDDDTDARPSLLSRILTLFSLFSLALRRFRAADFRRLRKGAWQLDGDEYRESFRLADRRGGALKPVGDLGYSGSTFFTTPNAKFLIKSLPRRFEYTFFANDLLDPYIQHMHTYPNSLLVRITDFLEAIAPSLGGSILGTAPAHHIIMENVLFGKDNDEQKERWETYDLKPASYFYPERDIADGRLAPESVKERLIDKFPDKVRVTSAQRDELLAILGADTELLRRANAVDYSLFLVRYPAQPEREVPSVEAKRSAWREGVRSSDGKWVYRAVVLDFFWAKHKTQPKMMTRLIKSFNFFAHKGPMSITTNPDEYRSRFLKMAKGYIDDGSEQQ